MEIAFVHNLVVAIHTRHVRARCSMRAVSMVHVVARKYSGSGRVVRDSPKAHPDSHNRTLAENEA